MHYTYMYLSVVGSMIFYLIKWSNEWTLNVPNLMPNRHVWRWVIFLCSSYNKVKRFHAHKLQMTNSPIPSQNKWYFPHMSLLLPHFIYKLMKIGFDNLFLVVMAGSSQLSRYCLSPILDPVKLHFQILHVHQMRQQTSQWLIPKKALIF